MKSIIQNAYEDAQLEMKKVIPEKMQMSFRENKKKFFFVILIAVTIELFMLSGTYEMIFG